MLPTRQRLCSRMLRILRRRRSHLPLVKTILEHNNTMHFDHLKFIEIEIPPLRLNFFFVEDERPCSEWGMYTFPICSEKNESNEFSKRFAQKKKKKKKKKKKVKSKLILFFKSNTMPSTLRFRLKILPGIREGSVTCSYRVRSSLQCRRRFWFFFFLFWRVFVLQVSVVCTPIGVSTQHDMLFFVSIMAHLMRLSNSFKPKSRLKSAI